MAGIDISGGSIPSLTNTLTDTHIFVGNINNEPADVALTLSSTGGTFALANTGVLTMPNADSITRGLLTAADWVTFNNKQNAIPDWGTGFNSATQATSTWTATNAAANVNAALIPKGTGAIVANLPNGIASGGNARGQYAVDLQRVRSLNTQVASGSYSSILGGQNNTASGSHSTSIGQGNTASGTNSFSGGNGSTASGENSFVFGTCTSNAEAGIAMGRGCTANNPGQRGMIAMGNGCTTTYEGGVSMGATCSSSNFGAVSLGQSNSATGLGTRATGSNSRAELQSQISHAGGFFTAQGDAQSHELIWRRAITGTAQTELFLDGSSIAAILPSTNSVWHGIIDISSICTVSGAGTTVVGNVAATSYKVTIKRLNTNTSLVGTVQEIGTINADTSMAAVVFTIDNNDTNESLRIRFTPPPTAAADTIIRVVATFRGTQIKY